MCKQHLVWRRAVQIFPVIDQKEKGIWGVFLSKKKDRFFAITIIHYPLT